jgi:hypothetical protein
MTSVAASPSRNLYNTYSLHKYTHIQLHIYVQLHTYLHIHARDSRCGVPIAKSSAFAAAVFLVPGRYVNVSK